MIPCLRIKGLRLAVIKKSHHDFEIDQPGKDSYRLRQAGAQQMLLASAYRTALVTEGDGQTEPELGQLLKQLDSTAIDLVLVEGFRTEPIPKIEVHRPSLGTPLLCRQDKQVIALACDAILETECGIPLLPLNDPDQVAEFIQQWMAG